MKLNEQNFEATLEARLGVAGPHPELFIGERTAVEIMPANQEQIYHPRHGSPFKQTFTLGVLCVNGQPWKPVFLN